MFAAKALTITRVLRRYRSIASTTESVPRQTLEQNATDLIKHANSPGFHDTVAGSTLDEQTALCCGHRHYTIPEQLLKDSMKISTNTSRKLSPSKAHPRSRQLSMKKSRSQRLRIQLFEKSSTQSMLRTMFLTFYIEASDTELAKQAIAPLTFYISKLIVTISTLNMEIKHIKLFRKYKIFIQF